MTRAEAYEHICSVCSIYGASITSAFRSPARNVRVGGSPYSKHLAGEGFDIVTDTDELIVKVAAALRTRGLYVEIEDDHIHAQSAPPER